MKPPTWDIVQGCESYVGDFGPCCLCGCQGSTWIMLLLDGLAPMPGLGWGCTKCGLAANGAIALACPDCGAALADGRATIVYICYGAVNEPGRMPLARMWGGQRHAFECRQPTRKETPNKETGKGF